MSKLMYFPSALDLLGLLLYHLLWLVILADLCMALFTQLYSFLRLPMYYFLTNLNRHFGNMWFAGG